MVAAGEKARDFSAIEGHRHVDFATPVQMDATAVADAGSGERHTGRQWLVRLFKRHKAFMPIR